MTDATAGMPDDITGATLTSAAFSPAKGFSRGGYDAQEVDRFLRLGAAAVDRLNGRLVAAEQRLREAGAQIQELRDRIERDSRTNEVQHAISVLTTAQITADSTVAQADEYSARVMTEARDLYDDARRDAAVLQQETEDKSRAVYEDALQRVADVERENQQRLAQLTLAAVSAQNELDEQTTYLRTLRDAASIQMQKFLEGMLDHVAEEYGRAHPMAAEAAGAARLPAARRSVAATPGTRARRSRRNQRLPRRPGTPSAPTPKRRTPGIDDVAAVSLGPDSRESTQVSEARTQNDPGD